jgi:hypothetical protein
MQAGQPIDVHTLIPEEVQVPAILENYLDYTLKKDSERIILTLYRDNTLTIHDPTCGYALALYNTSVEWEPKNKGAVNQRFRLIRTAESKYPYALQGVHTGRFVGVDKVSFLSIKTPVSKDKVGAWESFNIRTL